MTPSYLSIILLLGFYLQNSPTKKYYKSYYENGTLKEEGWKIGSKKTDFWHFYTPDGTVKEEGHFKNNKKLLIMST